MTELSRRDILHLAWRAGALLGGGVILTACGAAGAPASVSGGAAAPSQVTAPSPSIASAKPAASVAAKPVSSAGASASTSAGKLRSGYTALSAPNMPLWMADASGGFRQRSLDVSMQFLDGSAATKALIAKDLDVLFQGAAGLVAADLNGGVDLVFIGAVLNHPSGSLIVAPSIQSAADLKGKPVGTGTPGTAPYFQTSAMLSKLGLKTSDVELRALGDSSTQMSSLFGGQVAAATLSPPFSFQATAKSFKELVNSYDIPFLDMGIVASKARIDELAPALVAFLAACRQGIQAFNDQPDLALKTMQGYTKQDDHDVLQKTYDFYRKSVPYQQDLQPLPESIQSTLNVLGSGQVPAAKSAKPQQFMDVRLLAQLPK